ncbi:hypothetical protein GCM10029978_047360 [Actinoallomurus acanthiterrae]
MTRRGQIVTVGPVAVETYADGDTDGLDVVLPSYGRDGGEDFDRFAAALAGAGHRVLRPRPRGITRSAGPATGVPVHPAPPQRQRCVRSGDGRCRRENERHE